LVALFFLLNEQHFFVAWLLTLLVERRLKIFSSEKEQMPHACAIPAKKISGLMECRTIKEPRGAAIPADTEKSSCRRPFQTGNGNEIGMGQGPTHWHLLAAARSMRFGNCFKKTRLARPFFIAFNGGTADKSCL
jgi:hypothetical protein